MSRKEYSKRIKELHAAGYVISELDFSRIILDDSPDIIVECKEGKRVGIEVVSCTASSIRSNDDENKTRVSNNIAYAIYKYRERLIKENRVPIILDINFRKEVFNVSKTIKQDEFTKIIIEEIERHRRNDEIFKRFHEGQQDKDVCEKYNEMNRRGEFDYKYIDSIKYDAICPVSDRTLYFCGDIKYSDIEPVILGKEEKLRAYKSDSKNNNIDEYWLIINVPYEEHLWIDDYKQDVKVVSGYDKIYLTGWDDTFKEIK